jgi:acetyl-CoA carboxylase biotin carboxylase subunit
VRVDSGVYGGYEVPIHYDPMIAKLICWGRDREEAISRSIRALREYRVRGIRTSIPFFTALLRDPEFQAGTYSTGFLSPERMARLTDTGEADRVAILAAALARYEADNSVQRPAHGGAVESAWKRQGRVSR